MPSPPNIRRWEADRMAASASLPAGGRCLRDRQRRKRPLDDSDAGLCQWRTLAVRRGRSVGPTPTGEAKMRSKLHVAQSSKYMGDDWWRWSVWIEGSLEELAAVDSVTWHLHPTFPQPVVQLFTRADKFRLKGQAWGG